MRDKLLNECVEDLKKLHALPPYDGPSNICANDGHFERSIREKYDIGILVMANNIVYEYQKNWEQNRNQFLTE